MVENPGVKHEEPPPDARKAGPVFRLDDFERGGVSGAFHGNSRS
jgi:hypothetical protein